MLDRFTADMTEPATDDQQVAGIHFMDVIYFDLSDDKADAFSVHFLLADTCNGP